MIKHNTNKYIQVCSEALWKQIAHNYNNCYVVMIMGNLFPIGLITYLIVFVIFDCRCYVIKLATVTLVQYYFLSVSVLS